MTPLGSYSAPAGGLRPAGPGRVLAPTRTGAAHTARTDRGWSMFETMVAIGIIATGLMVLVQQLSISFRESNANENRAFAYQKAAALLGEINNAILLGRLATSDDLYSLADTAPNTVLTTRTDGEGLVFAPDHPMSGNSMRRDHWSWARRINVSPQENVGLYYCRVELLHYGDDDQWHSEANHAQLFSLLPSTESPEQIHDVYVLACAETPSLWSDLAELHNQIEAAKTAITGQSQAQVRLHWITRLGYGRDPCYAPFVNTARASNTFAPACYWLPGVLGGADIGKVLYQSDLLTGMHATELGLLHGRSSAEPVPSTIADQFNHCLRTPAAWRLFAQRVAAGLEHDDAPPLQLLLDDMQQRPERYRNAIFVNLHGRGLPLPPLRNYSDAAKDPIGRPGVRVVTHPARLQTPRDPDGNGNHADTQSLELRVYGWRTMGTGDVLTEPVLVQIFGADLTGSINGGPTATLLVDRLAGGIDTTTGKASLSAAYLPFAAAPTAAVNANEMWFQSGFVAGSQPYTWLRLYNTPLVAPAVGTRGLATNGTLYGYQYVPSPVNGAFTQDLATDSIGLMMRNTARWRIRLPKQVFVGGLLANTDQALRVVTRIGTDTTTGQRWPVANQPLNASETWAWWSSSANAVPATERAQFLGDPRLCPYQDLMATGTDFQNGYNWNFDDLSQPLANAQLLWPCLDATRLRDGFAGGPRADAPRLLQLWRNALQTSADVFVAPVDRLAHTLLLGGEIAVPTATATAGAAIHTDFTGGTLTSIDTIDPAANGTLVLQRGEPATWWQKPWLGELFPDDLGGKWMADGNLPLSGLAGLHWRPLQNDPLTDLPYGTTFTGPMGSVMDQAGAAVFVAHAPTPITAVTFGAAAAALQSPTIAVEDVNLATNLVPPSSLSGARAISLAGALLTPPPALTATDAFPHSTATLLENGWTNPSGSTGMITTWAGPAGTAWLAPWSTAASPSTAREVALQALLLGIRGLHAAGLPSLPSHIPQLPRVEILEPSNGSSRLDPDVILVRWQTAWQRFDGRAYTDDYPTPYSQNEGDLLYRVLWSADAGATWTSALTDAPTQIGSWPTAVSERLADAGNGNESFSFPFPSTLPAGEYVIRVEAWRTTTHLHNATHQVRLFVRRTP